MLKGELTNGTGPLRIYRVLGTAFLNSRDTLHPILAKSQCWCVDGESKFVLRIRPNSYYRIELSYSTAEDIEKVEEFKRVLAKVLQYEVTPCPFKRGFTVPLPEQIKTPIRKRPWRPKQRSQSLVAGLAQESGTTDEDTAAASDGSSARSTNNEHEIEADATAVDFEEMVGSYEPAPDSLKTPTRPKGLSAGRAITAPPHLSLHTTAPSNTLTAHLEPIQADAESPSLSSSVDSFHSFCSFHSPISPLPPSPPYSDPPSPSPSSSSDLGIHITRTRAHKREISEVTIKADSPGQWDMTQSPTRLESVAISPALPETPTLTNDAESQEDDQWREAITPSTSTELRRRPGPAQRRAHSPLLSPTNLYSPRSRMSGHHLTTAILQKTCSLLLGPPIQLVALMLNIAKKIANGVFQGATFGYGEAGQRIPCAWDYSDVDEAEREVWAEDDYGVSLRNSPAARNTRARDLGGSWEID